ncbi:Oleosin 14.9 kDa [Spatholobus suberectus]|nr:Oleosin 14.9 kDa [Spatholobus suberectus]
MADHHPSLAQTQTTTRPNTTSTASSPLLRKLREHASNSGQLFGVLALLITGSILLLLTGLTVVGTVLGLILFAPLIIVTSPIWVPLCAVLFLVTAAFLSMCGFGLVAVAALTWVYRQSKGHRPPGSNRALNRAKDRAGHLQSKVMTDAAPGA